MGLAYNAESALTAFSPAMLVFGLLVCTISMLQYLHACAEGDIEADTKKEDTKPLLKPATEAPPDSSKVEVPDASSNFAMGGFGAPAYSLLRGSKQLPTTPFEGLGHRL